MKAFVNISELGDVSLNEHEEPVTVLRPPVLRFGLTIHNRREQDSPINSKCLGVMVETY